MKEFRMRIDAGLYFTVEALDAKEAKRLAKEVLTANLEGWSVEEYETGIPFNMRVYPNSDKKGNPRAAIIEDVTEVET